MTTPAIMKAFVYRTYGDPDILRLEDLPVPVPKQGEVLVKVRAAAGNAMDYYFMRGLYLMRIFTGLRGPKKPGTPGVEMSGVVEAVGPEVTRFKMGDEVFGAARSSFGEYVVTTESRLILKGESLSFEDASGLPVAGMTALQGLRDKARLRPGQHVLINGAAGGIGTYAVQIAKAMGAEVTGVCSTRNVEFVRSLGADHVIDYTKEDFTSGSVIYDALFDIIGNHSMKETLRVLTANGVFVPVGIRSGGKVVGPLPHLVGVLLASWFASQRVQFFMAKITVEDLTAMREMIESGKVRPVTEVPYPFPDAPKALSFLKTGHARGKVVVTLP